MRASLASVAICGVTLTLGALVIRLPGAGYGVAVGAAIAFGNLWALARIVAALLPNARVAPGSLSWAALASLKMFALFASVWLLLRFEVVSPLAMLAGFAALPIGIAIGSLVSDIAALQ